MGKIKSRAQLAKQLGKKIRQVRTSRGISLKHFEALEGSISRHSLSDIENGKKLPSVYTLYKISELLKVPLRSLIEDV